MVNFKSLPAGNAPTSVRLFCRACGASATAPILPLAVEPPGFAKLPAKERRLMVITEAVGNAIAQMVRPD